MEKKQTFKIATFNANSVRKRVPIILHWLQKEKPDVLALQETKVEDAQFPREAFEKEGWRLLFRGQKGYNGVAFISREPLTDPVFFLHDQKEEARFLSAKWKNILLINTYVPQGYLITSDKYRMKLQYFKRLREWFEKNVRTGQSALWMGDLNVARTELDVDNPKTKTDHVCFHIDARQAFEETVEGIWVDLFREKIKEGGHYTFWDYRFPSAFQANKGWRIDYILGTPPMVKCLKRIWIDKEPRAASQPSDHTFLIAEFLVS